MSDRVRLSGVGRISKEPNVGEKSVTLEVVSNLYQKSEDPKNNTHPMWIRLVITGGLSKFVTAQAGTLKGRRVWFEGDFNFNEYAKRDGTKGIGYTVFPTFLEVMPLPQASNADPQTAATTDSTNKSDDDLPF
jgi:single-stranded DNA-binding protein